MYVPSKRARYSSTRKCWSGRTPPGTYELLLHLSDEYESLAGRPEYAIRLTNEEVWKEDTGCNRLHHDVVIK